MTGCPEAIGPAVCRVPGPHDAHLYVTDPVWEKCRGILEPLMAPPAPPTPTQGAP